MKKLIAFALTLLLILTLIVPASAATTMHWDWGKARGSINNAVTEIVTAPSFSWSAWLSNLLEAWK